MVTSISIYMRLSLIANGGFLSVLPASMLFDQADRKWLRALAVDLRDSPATISAITLKKRRASGAVKLFLERCREVAKDMS
jgi:DNA-binding transcriptional LysR family regulator